MDARPNNLPVHLTNLIGRDNDIADVVRLLGRYRLVTLAGAGGIGKTRMAQHAGAEMLNDFPDGVWFVELAGLTDPGHVAGAVAAVLGVRSAEDRPPLQSIVDALRHKRTLIILDNCEHVAAACAVLAFTLLQQCPSVRVIDTSRETLHVDGEYVYRVPSLSVPPVRERLTAESAQRFGAIALFVERAAATGAGFTLTDANAPIVADICRRLDGIPLAIELAAPRTRVLSLSKVAEKLDDRFRLLEGGNRTAMPRQQTLRALIGWSHDLLSQREAILFRRLSVFSGTFGIEAATAICADEALPEEDVLDVLASLVDKSLVLAEQVIEDQRFRMLESIRDFARERLSAANERVGFARRHAEYYRNLAREVRVENRGQDEIAAVLSKLDVDLDNFRAAMDWCIAEGGDFELGTVIAAELSSYWENRGLESEGLSRLESGLKSFGADEPTVTKAQAFAAIMSLAFPTRQFQRSLDAALRAGEIARELGDQALLGRARRGEGDALSQFGKHDEAALALDEALILLRAAGLDRAVEGCMLDQAMNESARGNYDHARRIYEELDGRFRAQGDTVRLCHVAINLAETEFAAGNVPVATTLLEEILPVLKASPHFILAVRCNLASYFLANGEIERGKAAARTSLELCLTHGYSAFAVVPMETLALVAAIGGDILKAARILGFTDSVIASSGAPRERTEQLTYDRLMAVLRESLPENELTNALKAGAATSQETAIAEALAV